ncbi:MAG: glycosyltransferase family 39 protein [Nibricoccus sp.]
MSIPPATPEKATWLGRLTSPVAAAIVLLAFWGFMLSSVQDKSLTSDEIVHAVAGCTYWKFNDYRLNPENGNLPQRVAALPLVWGGYAPPPRDSEMWHLSEEWAVGDFWFHQMGYSVEDMLLRGRAAIGLLTALLGALVWWWARRLFGPLGGMLSLLVFVLNPTILANGALMTSDATCALFFLASVASFWAVLHRLTAARLIVSGLIVGGLFVSKMSAVLMLPIGATLIAGRLLQGRPLWIGFGLDRELPRRSQQALAFAGVALAHVLLVPLVIWAFYGFRFASFAPPGSPQDRFQHPWEVVLEKPGPLASLHELDLTADQQLRANEALARYDWRHKAAAGAEVVLRTVLTPPQSEKLHAILAQPPPAPAAKVFDFLRRHELLPEGYIYGYAHAWRFSRVRSAFFNGKYGISGWKTFFPYTFLVKTPLPMLGLLGLAAAAAWFKWRSEGADAPAIRRQAAAALYATLPLWALLVFYWAAVIPSKLNIGHRHILATYPPLIMLCGAAAYWIETWRSRARSAEPNVRMPQLARVCSFAVCGLAVLLIAEIGYRYPHYLAYFNGIVTPAKAYRHVVDSSLDWGQDLRGLKRYLEARPLEHPVYLSYFGTASPRYYGIAATPLYNPTRLDLPRTPVRELQTNTKDLALELAAAKRAWPDCELIAQHTQPDGAVKVFFLQKPALPPLRGGTYCVSATMLQAIFYGLDGPLGHWNDRFESTYRELQRSIEPLLNNNPAKRAEAFARAPAQRWTEILELFTQYRFARLTAYLRQREPEDHIGYSILIYHLTDADLEAALNGPPPELGEDLPTALVKRGET